jgi:DNA replication protein DnaC
VKEFCIRIRDNIESWLLNQDTFGIYLYSLEPGTGKTAMACDIAKKAVLLPKLTSPPQYNVQFVLWPSIIEDRTYGSFETKNKAWRKVKEPHLLILDDISGNMESKAIQMLVNLLRARIYSGYKTIITGNILSKDITDIFGADVKSLFNYFIHLSTEGKDYREHLQKNPDQ